MDPQQRLALELTHHAFESAGLDRGALEGPATGVHRHDRNDTRSCSNARGPDHHDLTALPAASWPTGSRTSSAARTQHGSHTGQSSSLVAVHLAAESLRNGEADIAVAAG